MANPYAKWKKAQARISCNALRLRDSVLSLYTSLYIHVEYTFSKSRSFCSYNCKYVSYNEPVKDSEKGWWKGQNGDLPSRYCSYSLADLFFLLFVTKSLCLPSKFGKPIRGTSCVLYLVTNFLSQLSKCWFCSLGPIVKFAM